MHCHGGATSLQISPDKDTYGRQLLIDGKKCLCTWSWWQHAFLEWTCGEQHSDYWRIPPHYFLYEIHGMIFQVVMLRRIPMCQSTLLPPSSGWSDSAGKNSIHISMEYKSGGKVQQSIGSRKVQSGSQWEVGKVNDTSKRGMGWCTGKNATGLQHYMVSQTRRNWCESSLPWKPHTLLLYKGLLPGWWGWIKRIALCSLSMITSS